MRGTNAKKLRSNATELAPGLKLEDKDIRPFYRYLKKAWGKIPTNLKGLDNSAKS